MSSSKGHIVDEPIDQEILNNFEKSKQYPYFNITKESLTFEEIIQCFQLISTVPEATIYLVSEDTKISYPTFLSLLDLIEQLKPPNLKGIDLSLKITKVTEDIICELVKLIRPKIHKHFARCQLFTYVTEIKFAFSGFCYNDDLPTFNITRYYEY